MDGTNGIEASNGMAEYAHHRFHYAVYCIGGEVTLFSHKIQSTRHKALEMPKQEVVIRLRMIAHAPFDPIVLSLLLLLLYTYIDDDEYFFG